MGVQASRSRGGRFGPVLSLPCRNFEQSREAPRLNRRLNKSPRQDAHCGGFRGVRPFSKRPQTNSRLSKSNVTLSLTSSDELRTFLMTNSQLNLARTGG